jgi:hypothetical protein
MPKKGWPSAVSEVKTSGLPFKRGTGIPVGKITARTVGTPKKGR